MKTSTTQEFIERSTIIHNNKYDYSLVNYLTNDKKVIIICPIHGDFLQTPNKHLKGHGCIKCKFMNSSISQKCSQEEFIEKARSIHGDKYDYSLINYISTKTKVTIICPEHGYFEQRASAHLYGQGCPKCGMLNTISLQQSNKEEFIEKAKKIHGWKFDYSKIIYINSYSKVTIICIKHGEFEQTPVNHLSGNGCQKCRKSKGELAIKAILEKYNIKNEEEYKLPEIVSNYEYDFYLPEYRLLIEFHGGQHYYYVHHFHKTEDKFLKQKNRDDIKKDNAYRFKYRFLEFNYKQLKEITEEQFEELVIKNINKFKKS